MFFQIAQLPNAELAHGRDYQFIIEQIQIYTRGCVRSIAVEKSLREAVSKMGLDVAVEAYDDPIGHKAEGLDSFPSVEINGELRGEGDSTSVEDFEEMLSEYRN